MTEKEAGDPNGPGTGAETTGMELDLTKEEPPPETRAPEPRVTPVEVQVVREGMRGRIALGLLLVIGGVVAGAFAAAAWDWASAPDLKDLLTQVYNPLVGLFGAVIGFYFGSMGQESVSISTKPK